MLKKKPYMMETSIPSNAEGHKHYSYPMDKQTPMTLNTQSLVLKNDMERLIQKGLTNASFMKQILQNTSCAEILNHAEASILKCRSLSDEDRQQCFAIINNHPVRNLQVKRKQQKR